MAANTAPIFTLVPAVGWSSLTAANNVYDGTGTVGTIETVGVEGGYIGFIKLKPLGTNVTTVARFFINNGSTNATAANNCLFAEVTLPATTTSAVAALTELLVPVNFALPNGYKINWCLGTAVAAGWMAMAVSGDY